MSLTPLLMKVALLGVEWVLWLLFVLSAASIAIAFDKFLLFYRARLPVMDVTNKFQKVLHDDGVDAAKKYLEKFKHNPQMRILMAGLDETGSGKEAMKNAMIARQALEKSRMEKFLSFLTTLGNNAPFIGLFGTVIGIMGAFFKLHSNVTGGTSVVMRDISEALVATAVGLFVAIPAVIFNNIFRQKIRNILTDVTILSSILFNYMEAKERKEKTGD